MTQTFQDILSQVQAQSDPQRSAIMNQIAALPNQQQADESGLNAQKNAAYDQITNQAQERGMGFSGIPLGEQAKYDSTTYAPALASLKNNYVTQQGNLQTALAGVGSNDYSTAMGQYNTQQSLAEQQREFDANLSLQKQQASQPNPLAGLFQPSPPSPPTGPTNADPYGAIDKKAAQGSVAALLKTNDIARINQEYNAIKKSAGYGNIFDQYKLQLINATMQPTQTTAYNPTIANLVKNAINYKAPAPTPSIGTQAKNFVTKAGPGNLSLGNLENNLKMLGL